MAQLRLNFRRYFVDFLSFTQEPLNRFAQRAQQFVPGERRHQRPPEAVAHLRRQRIKPSPFDRWQAAPLTRQA